MVDIDFDLNQSHTIVQANLTDLFQDVINKYFQKTLLEPESVAFIANGKEVNPSASVQSHMNKLDKDKKKLKVLVNMIESNEAPEEVITESEEIICPQCNEINYLEYGLYMMGNKIKCSYCGHGFSKILCVYCLKINLLEKNIFKYGEFECRYINCGKKSILEYEAISYDKEDNCSLVSLDLKTGRHHQIRVQFASRGHYLLGDQRYGVLDNTQICLFAYYLSFVHPVTRKVMEFKYYPSKEGYWNKFTF